MTDFGAKHEECGQWYHLTDGVWVCERERRALLIQRSVPLCLVKVVFAVYSSNLIPAPLDVLFFSGGEKKYFVTQPVELPTRA